MLIRVFFKLLLVFVHGKLKKWPKWPVRVLICNSATETSWRHLPTQRGEPFQRNYNRNQNIPLVLDLGREVQFENARCVSS